MSADLPFGHEGPVYKNSHALTIPLEQGFVYVKNPLISGGEQILNPLQHRIFSSVDGSSVADLAGNTGVPADDIQQALQALSRTGLVSRGKFDLPKAPKAGRSLSLWVHTSNSCNLGCSYCYVNAEQRGPKMKRQTIRAVAGKVLRAADSEDLETVTLKIAGGEPLLTFPEWKADLARLKHDLEDRGVAVHLHLLTNGTVFTREIVDYVLENEIGVGVSVDGFGATHDASRYFVGGKGSFSVVQRNLERFRSAGLRPYITTVVSENNVDSLDTLTAFFVSENLGFRFSLEKGGNPIGRARIARALTASYSLVESAIPKYQLFLSHTLCDLSFVRPVVDTPCGVGRSRASVNVDGSLHTCQTEHSRTPIGNLIEERDLLEIINTSKVAEGLASVAESCESCSYRFMCAGGCPTFKANRKSPYCGTFHDFIPTILRLRGLTLLSRIAAQHS